MIDGHFHLLPPGPGALGNSVEDMLRRFDDHGVRAGIAVGVTEADHYLDQALQRHPHRFAGIAVAPPAGDNVVAVMSERQARTGYGGIRLTSAGHPGQAGYLPLYRWQADNGLALWSHARGARDLSDLERLARQLPDLPIVLEHLGLAPPAEGTSLAAEGTSPAAGGMSLAAGGMSLAGQAEHVASLADCPNVRLMVSGAYALADAAPRSHLVRITGDLVARYGPSRCMWASDWPFSSVRLTYQQTMAAIAETLPSLGPADLSMICGGTAALLFPHLGQPG